ncbi:MAG: Na+/H+ antiporter subunit E [Lachnospiraceae bacterium]|nr:Na+/H+ antiporter subunit E [Lachnospiraceae bacterium]
MVLLFFLAWIIFNGKITWEIVLTGLAISAGLFAFVCRFMDYSVEKEKLLAKKSGRIVKTLGVLLIEILKANWEVAKRIYNPKHEVEPALITFHTDLKTDYARTVLADCITMTPGTITGELQGDAYTVHCLDKPLGEGLKESSFVKVLRELEAED